MSKCQKCKHRTDSKYHQVHCLGRRGAQIKRRRSSAGRSSGGRGHSAAACLSFSYAASGPIASASFFEDRAKDEVQS